MTLFTREKSSCNLTTLQRELDSGTSFWGPNRKQSKGNACCRRFVVKRKYQLSHSNKEQTREPRETSLNKPLPRAPNELSWTRQKQEKKKEKNTWASHSELPRRKVTKWRPLRWVSPRPSIELIWTQMERKRKQREMQSNGHSKMYKTKTTKKRSKTAN